MAGDLLFAPRPPLAGKHEGTFAYYTIRDRIPVILTKVIDDIHKTVCDIAVTDENAERIQEGKKLIESIAGLKYDMQRDRPMRTLTDKLPDVDLWNTYLETYWKDMGYFQAAWLFEECYIYRRIIEALALTTHWQDYDPFRREKEGTFTRSADAILSLAERLDEIYLEEATMTTAQVEGKVPLQEFRARSFEELLQYSLWGNSVDLSLLASASHADISKLQTTNRDHLEASRKNILVNDTEQAWAVVGKLQGGRIDFVLDNAGFELLADLFLADWLLQKNYASVIVFHVKDYPWYVSDTTEYDFTTTIANAIRLGAAGKADSSSTPASAHAALHTIAARWQSYLDAGQFRLHHSAFWTLPHPFYHLPRFADIYDEQLVRSDFVLFKGDLNFRKLVFDCAWEPVVTFREAVGPLGQPRAEDGKRMAPLVSLRTLKSDICVGLQHGRAEQLTELDKDWKGNGKWGTIHTLVP
ncbi:Hairy/enhancer-of-split with YRPW motif protein 2 [Sorochytrium milnesiophthora]